jgi:hypothetical protein
MAFALVYVFDLAKLTVAQTGTLPSLPQKIAATASFLAL